MQRTIRYCSLVIAMGMVAGETPRAWAVPYASGVRTTTGSMREFVLNESADNVTVLRDGSNALNLGGLTAGRHTFDLGSFSTFSIEVSKNTPSAWTAISGDGSNLFTRYEQPAGVAVNRNPASPYFGTVYVVNSRNLPTATAAGGTIPARQMGEGVYALTSDLVGVDLANNFAAVADPQDASQAKAPNWVMDTSTTVTSGRRSPWRLSLDNAGNLIVADWSVNTGGLKWASANLTQGGRLLDQENSGSLFGVTNGNGDYFHSSLPSRPIVTGTLGVDLTVTALDTYLEAVPFSAGNDGQNVWRWNLGSHDPATMGGFDQVPQLIINGSNLGGDTVWFVGVQGVTASMYYSPQHNLYYLTQPRSNGTEPSLLIVDANLGNDPSGNTPIIKFNSLQFTEDNGLDGAVGTVCCGGEVYEETGGQDIFRMAGNVEVSADGTKMFLRRAQTAGTAAGTGTAENPVLGLSSNNPGGTLVIPLDGNGLPMITIDDMGTTEKLDDRITNFQSIVFAAPGSNPAAYDMTYDAAGNVYITHSSSELLQVFSPGGNTKATTNSNGTFSVVTIAGVLGDYNDNGVVDAADYTVWRNNLGAATLPNRNPSNTGPVDAADYDFWKSRFGFTSGSGLGGGGVVPEPGTGLLAMLGLIAAAAGRRRLA